MCPEEIIQERNQFSESQEAFIVHANSDIKTYANNNNNITRKQTSIVSYY